MRRINTPKRAVAGLGVALLAGAAAPAGAQESPCTRFAGPPSTAGTVADPALIEISGVAASRAHPGVLWVHNDSGGQPAVTALSDSGEDLGTYRVPGAEATDWEDIAAGPGPDPEQDYLYVGDIGDNAEGRESVQVHRVPEPDEAPDGADGRFAEDVVLTLHYPTGPVDAEALLVDPVTGDLVIVGKRPQSAPVFAADAAAIAVGGDVELRQVATLDAAPTGGPPGPLGLVTGGDVSPDGSVVLLRTYLSVAAYARAEGEPLAAAFAGTPCAAPRADEPQGEAVGFLADGSAYVTISEGVAQPINRVAVSPPLATTTTTTSAATTAAPSVTEDESEDGFPAWAWITIPVAIVGVLALAAVIRRRRR